MNIRTFFAVMLLLLSVAPGPAAELPFVAKPLPATDALFQRTNGWIGADGAFSVPLSPQKTVWLFSDTFVGDVQGGKRANARMINNSVAVQQAGGTPEFFYRTNKQGQPESFIKPKDGRGHFWLMHGLRANQSLFLILSQIKTVDPSAFGFRSIGLWLGRVDNPDDPPLEWKIKQTKIPFAKFSRNETLSVGAAILADGEFAYVYGACAHNEKQAGKTIRKSGLILARVPPSQFDDFKAWRFFSNGQWSGKIKEATFVCPDAASECSVSYVPGLRKYALIYTAGIWGQIMMRTAPAPAGPWSEPTRIFRAPEMQWSPKVFAYAAKAHPELSGPDELILTYAANSFTFSEVINDARLYWPRFVLLKFQP